jgi:hypothetical protein
MTYRTLVFFIFPIVVGLSVLSTTVVVGFAPSSSASSTTSFRGFTTTLRYASESSGYQDDRYHHSSSPDEMQVVDVEVESGDSQFVYVPFHEMENAVKKAQKKHERDCEGLQNTIDEQRQELKILLEKKNKSRSVDRKEYVNLSANAKMNWGENHNEKTKRTTDRLKLLTDENERIQTELDSERERFELENGILKQKLEESRDETTQAQQILSLERSYFETAVKLLEHGLERETKNVKILEEQLMEYNQWAAEQIQNNNDLNDGFHDDRYPFYSSSMQNDNFPPYETWEGPVNNGYEHQQEQEYNHNHHDFRHHPQHQHQHQHQEEEFEEFHPQVRPQDNHIYSQQHEARTSFHSQEHHVEAPQPQQQQQHFHSQATTQQRSSNRRPAKAATTTVMGAPSIMDNIGIMYR